MGRYKKGCNGKGWEGVGRAGEGRPGGRHKVSIWTVRDERTTDALVVVTDSPALAGVLNLFHSEKVAFRKEGVQETQTIYRLIRYRSFVVVIVTFIVFYRKVY